MANAEYFPLIEVHGSPTERGVVANYLHQITGVVPSAATEGALTSYLIAVMDHGFNASTFTARVIASTGADAAACLVGALGALTGPLHGGAPSRALDGLDAVGTADRIEPWIRDIDRHVEAGGFPEAVDGYVSSEMPIAFQWQLPEGFDADAAAVANAGIRSVPQQAGRVIGEKIRQVRRLTGHEAPFLKVHAHAPYKVTMPAPSYVVARGFKPGVTTEAYPYGSGSTAIGASASRRPAKSRSRRTVDSFSGSSMRAPPRRWDSMKAKISSVLA